MTFYKDLDRGKLGEELVKKHFKALGYEVADVSDVQMWRDNDVDIITADGMKYEVKTDFRFYKTGNLALESEVIYDSGKRRKSWLWTSTADWFCFVNPHNLGHFVTIAADELRALVKTGQLRQASCHDYGKEVALYLLPYSEYKDCFIHETLGEEDFDD